MLSTLIRETQCLFFKVNKEKSCEVSLETPDEIRQSFKSELDIIKDPAFRSLLSGDGESLRQSCSNGFVQSWKDQHGNSIGMGLANIGRIDLLESLKSCGVSMKGKNNFGATSLHVADNSETVCWLLSDGYDVNDPDINGRTPVWIHAYKGNSNVIEILVKNGAKLNLPDKDGITPLMAAIEQGHTDTFTTLLNLGANVNCRTKSGNTALFYACMKKAKEIVRILVKKSDGIMNHEDTEGKTVLMRCVSAGYLDMVTLLHLYGARVNTKDKKGITALMIASVDKRNTDILQYLIKEHSEINAKNDEGQTALHFASATGNHTTVESLLEGGCAVDEIDEAGDTPLILAVRQGSKLCVERLLDKGACIDKENKMKRTALMEALVHKQYEIERLLGDRGASKNKKYTNGISVTEVASASPNLSSWTLCTPGQFFAAVEFENLAAIKNCIRKRYVNVQNVKGFTLLMVAAAKGSLEIMKYLIKLGASVNVRTCSGMTAIGCAAVHDKQKAVDLLIGHGADIDAKDRKGQTLLHRWVQEGSLNIVAFIARLGADLEVKDQQGCTPWMIAVNNGQDKIEKYLVSVGANTSTRSGNLLQREVQHEASDLITQSRLGDKENVRKICGCGAQLNRKDSDGNTPVHYASFHGHVTVLRVLLECGANPNFRNKQGRTPLMCALANNKTKAAKILFEYDALVNFREETCGNTALTYAVMQNQFEMVDILVNKTAVIDRTNVKGCTVIRHPCQNGSLDMVKYLTDSGADVNSQDKLGISPLIIAAAKGHKEIVEFLISNGANQHLTCKNGKTAIQHAKLNKQRDVVQWLKQYSTVSTKLDSLSYEYITTEMAPETEASGDDIDLCDAAKQGNPGMIRTAVRSDNNVEVVDQKGQNLIHHCAQGVSDRCCIVAEILYRNGCDIDRTDRNGSTPLITSIRHGNSNMAETLIELGADVTQGKGLLDACVSNNCHMLDLLLSKVTWPKDAITSAVVFCVWNRRRLLLTTMCERGVDVFQHYLSELLMQAEYEKVQKILMHGFHMQDSSEHIILTTPARQGTDTMKPTTSLSETSYVCVNPESEASQEQVGQQWHQHTHGDDKILVYTRVVADMIHL